MDKEQALLSLKYILCSKIDFNWGAGLVHINSIELLCGLDPNDEMLKTLLKRLKTRYEQIKQRYLDTDTYKQFGESMIVEATFRDEGKDEAEYYGKIIAKKYGKTYLEELSVYSWEL